MQKGLEVELTCPLGSKCEEAVDGKIKRCAWFTKLKGQDAQGEEHDEYGCAISWMPLLALENAREVRGVAAAAESQRNLMAVISAKTIPAERPAGIVNGGSHLIEDNSE